MLISRGGGEIGVGGGDIGVGGEAGCAGFEQMMQIMVHQRKVSADGRRCLLACYLEFFVLGWSGGACTVDPWKHVTNDSDQ